jgi:hypothetical protein
MIAFGTIMSDTWDPGPHDNILALLWLWLRVQLDVVDDRGREGVDEITMVVVRGINCYFLYSDRQ